MRGGEEKDSENDNEKRNLVETNCITVFLSVGPYLNATGLKLFLSAYVYTLAFFLTLRLLAMNSCCYDYSCSTPLEVNSVDNKETKKKTKNLVVPCMY